MQGVRGIRGKLEPGVREVQGPVVLKEQVEEEGLKGGLQQGGQVIKGHREGLKEGQVGVGEGKGVEVLARVSLTDLVKMQEQNVELLEVHEHFSFDSRVVLSHTSQCTNFCSRDNVIKNISIFFLLSYFAILVINYNIRYIDKNGSRVANGEVERSM